MLLSEDPAKYPTPPVEEEKEDSRNKNIVNYENLQNFNTNPTFLMRNIDSTEK